MNCFLTVPLALEAEVRASCIQLPEPFPGRCRALWPKTVHPVLCYPKGRKGFEVQALLWLEHLGKCGPNVLEAPHRVSLSPTYSRSSFQGLLGWLSPQYQLRGSCGGDKRAWDPHLSALNKSPHFASRIIFKSASVPLLAIPPPMVNTFNGFPLLKV